MREQSLNELVATQRADSQQIMQLVVVLLGLQVLSLCLADRTSPVIDELVEIIIIILIYCNINACSFLLHMWIFKFDGSCNFILKINYI